MSKSSCQEKNQKQGHAKTPVAAALRFNPAQDAAPRLVAKGRGELARKIVDTAKKHGRPVHSDPVLAAALMQLELLDEIPPRLYAAVAEVLAFVYSLDEKQSVRPAKDRAT